MWFFFRCGKACVTKDGEGGPGADVFSSFFGFGFEDQFGGERETPKGGNVVIELYVTLEELYQGNFVEVLLDCYFVSVEKLYPGYTVYPRWKKVFFACPKFQNAFRICIFV